MQMKLRGLMLFLLLFFAIVNPVQGASFVTLQGNCSEGDYSCGAYLNDISADGSAAVGAYVNWGDESPLLWSQSSGEEGLEFAGTSMCASKNGSVVYGMRYGGEGPYAFRWTMRGGTSYIEEVAEPWDTSADGSVMVGYAYRPIFWTQGNGVVALGELEGVANAVSSDGSVIVGYSDNQAFRWTESGGMSGLGFLSGTSDSVANGISGDGSIIVGKSGSQAFRWTESKGMTGLGYLPGTSNSVAYGISKDGSIIVGKSGNQAFIWDAANGMQNLKNILTNTYGLDMTGWDLNEARAISADGKTIIGNTTTENSYDLRYVGWIASIDTPDTPDQPCEFTPGPDACTSSCPCGEGEGDCDSDADCEAGLTCVQDVGAKYGWPASRDVCEAGCPEFVAGADACTSSCPCGEGEGDCDSDADCEAGLTCVQDVGAKYGWPASRDVCEAGCPEFVAGADACTSSCPCGEGEGDCDSDADCEAGLTCVQDVGAKYGWPASRDVCEAVCPEFVAGPDACTSSCPCGEGEGDCDSDDDCEAGLTCVQNVGADYGWTASRDVCEAVCPEFVAGPDACTSSCPCGDGEGDCDSDDDCKAGLICVENVGADYGWTESRDVCQYKPLSVYR